VSNSVNNSNIVSYHEIRLNRQIILTKFY